MVDYPAPRTMGVEPPAAAGAAAPAASGRVVMVHGFAQTGACLGPVADDLARDHLVVLPDAPGHGSAARFGHLGCATAAEALAAACGRGVWLGYSMGGRMALHVAVQRPRCVEALVLVGATAGEAGPDRRRLRAELDEQRAAALEADGVEAFLARWLDMPMFAGLPEWARFERERAANTVEGLAGSLRNAGTGAMRPLWGRLRALHMPVLLLAGDRDASYCANAARMAAAIGANASVVVVPDAGHAAHLEQPDAVIAAVRSWLRATVAGAVR
jgi:2-succinyl-6-hydroxy-2,4-cyclohexadiene-1-carboxylate synthase